MDEVRSWFEVPAIAHFFHVFKESFGLIEFEIEDFEEALFLDSAENVSSFLPDLVIRLLRGLYRTKDGLQVTIENYNNYLQDLLQYRYVTLEGKENPIAITNFKSIKTRTKIDIIYDMCNWRLEMEDAMELTKNLEAEEMRTEPVGIDAEGHVYWYFYGTRLYKEKVLDRDLQMNSDQDEPDQPPQKEKAKKRKKKKKKIVKTTKYGRAVKKRKLDYSSQEDEESEEESAEDSDEDESQEKKEDENISENGTAEAYTKTVNPWCVACSSLQHWEELVYAFKTPKNKNEKLLHKSLVELLDIMPEMFVDKEKAIQRKLLAMAPRRASDRIQLKAQTREMEERMKEQERLMKSQQKAKEAEERQKQLEKEKEKERERRYREREKNLEQRALRAKQREELKLVAENPELAKEIQTANKEKTSYKMMSFDLEGEEDDKYFAMERVLNVLKDHDDAWPFLEPVNESEAPDYYTFIEDPMDFSKMGEKIKDKEYKDKQEFENDMLLVVDNCETYNGTYSPFTKLAFKLKKVFDKMMKREFPPEIDCTDDLYEEANIEEAKVAKVKKTKTENTPREKTPKEKKPSKQHPKEKRMSLQSLQSYSTIITPEFAHAQIMQARLQQAQHQQSLAAQSGAGTSPQILPKLGIPQDILAKMSPAQLQMFMLQYRAGAFSGFNKGQTPLLPAQKNTITGIQQNPATANLIDPSSQSLYKLAGAAASLPPFKLANSKGLSVASAATTLSVTAASMNYFSAGGGLAPQKLQLSQLLSMQSNLPKRGGVTVLGKSPLIQRSVSKNSPILQNAATAPKPSPATLEKLVQGSVGIGGMKLPSTIGVSSKSSYVPTTMIPAGMSWESIKNSLKVQYKDSTKSSITTKTMNYTTTTAGAAAGATNRTIRLAPVNTGVSSVQLTANQMKGKQTLVAGNIAIRSATPNTFIRTQLSSIPTPGVNTIVPPSPGRLIIRGRNGQAGGVLSPKSLLTNNSRAATATTASSIVLKKVGIPLMNPNVRFIGQADGQIKKLIMVPSSSIALSGKSIVAVGTSAATIAIPNQAIALKKSTVLTIPAASVPPGAIAAIAGARNVPVGSVLAQPLRMKVPLSSIHHQQPVYLTQQGVPLQLIKPNAQTVRSMAQQPIMNPIVLSKVTPQSQVSVFSASGSPSQYLTQQKATPVLLSSVRIPTKQQTSVETPQSLHGLKKAIQQIAAVNQISFKLQNHLQDSNSSSSSHSNSSVKLVNAPSAHILASGVSGASGTLSINATAQKLIVPTNPSTPAKFHHSNDTASHMIVSVPNASVASLVAMVPTTTTTLSGSLQQQQQQQQQMIQGSVVQIPSLASSSGNSFVLTSNGLISINTNSQQQQQQQQLVDTKTFKQQNIIASNVPTLFNKQMLSTSVFSNQLFKNQPSSSTTTTTLLPKSLETETSTNTALLKSPKTGITANTLLLKTPGTRTASSRSVITPEKLRDAEALLGLIDPKRLTSSNNSSNLTPSSPHAPTASCDTILDNGDRKEVNSALTFVSSSYKLGNTSCSNNVQSSKELRISSLPMGSLIAATAMTTTAATTSSPIHSTNIVSTAATTTKLFPHTEQHQTTTNFTAFQLQNKPNTISSTAPTTNFSSLTIPMQVPVSALKIGSSNMILSSPAVAPKSPVNVADSVKLKSPVKIQLPGSSPGGIAFRTISSNILVSPVRTVKSPANIVSPMVTTKPFSNVAKETPIVQAKDIRTGSLSPNVRIGNGQPAGNTHMTHKMMVDQAQIQKLQAEGRLVVTPSGQMFLLASPATGTIPNSK